MISRRRFLGAVYAAAGTSFVLNNASIAEKINFIGKADAQAVFVQKGSHGLATGTATGISVSIAAVGSGHFIVGSVTSSDNAISNCTTTGGVGATITDNQSNTYGTATIIDDPANSTCLTTFYLSNITNGPVQITARFSQSTTAVGINVQEWSGVALATPLDKSETKIATSSINVSSGTITPSQGNELIYGIYINDSTPDTATSGNGAWTLRNNNATVTMPDESQVQGTAAPVQASFHLTGAATGPIAVLSFKQQAATGNTPYNPYISSPQLASILAQHHDLKIQSDLFVEHPFRRRKRYMMVIEEPQTEEGGKDSRRKPFDLNVFLRTLREREVKEYAYV